MSSTSLSPALAGQTARTSLADLARDPRFRLLWLAMFVSSIGSGVMTLALSLRILAHTESIFNANLVFAAQWIGALLMLPILGRLTRRWRSGTILVGAEISAALATLAVGIAAVLMLPLAYALLLPRAMASNTTRSVRFAALKAAVAPGHLEKAASVFNLCTYLGLAIGLSLVSLVSDWSLYWIGMLDATTFLTSAWCYQRFRSRHEAADTTAGDASAEADGTMGQAMRAIHRYRLWPLILLMVLTVGVFQAYLAVGRIALPLVVLGMESLAVTQFMVAQLTGVLLGPLLVARYLQTGSSGLRLLKRPVFWFLVTAAIAVLIPWYLSLWPLLLGFSLVTVTFEICFTLLNNRLVLAAPGRSIAMIMLLKNILALILMSLGLLLLGYFSDEFGFPTAGAALALLGAGVVLVMTVLFVGRARLRAPVQTL